MDTVVDYIPRIIDVFCIVLFNVIVTAVTRICIISVRNHWWRFLIEFVLISIPTMASINIFNSITTNTISIFGTLMLAVVLWRCTMKYVKQNNFTFGCRPQIVTLLRSNINFLTSFCILAVDFESFPINFRKSRFFGAGLMDMGIGLYAFSMGLVSQRFKKSRDLSKLVSVVGCLLILGAARTTVITLINYQQDEREYGVHLNSFFILGFTKLFGALISALAKNDNELLIMAIGTVVIHEIMLQCGLSDFVMNDEIVRNNLLSANREGVCSLLGFISIYLVAVYIGSKLKSRESLTFTEVMHVVKILGLASVISWMLVFLCTHTIGLVRVTCNFGYVTWILGTSFTMLLLFLVVFDIYLDTFYPITYYKNAHIKMKEMHLNVKIPLIMESINYNSLVYFLIANFLTGLINIFLEPENKTTVETFCLLLAYLFVINSVVFILFKFKLKVA